jgi:hypothetical protein
VILVSLERKELPQTIPRRGDGISRPAEIENLSTGDFVVNTRASTSWTELKFDKAQLTLVGPATNVIVKCKG